ncbi:MAG: AmmeMemoRadiSam system radical SAM enzyme [Hydrogenophilus sp.]|nr:AmmeMemoRadiSam system radical SAM enzyme [Hydrogenophilus sp.]
MTSSTLAPARWWYPLADGRIECSLCPRRCRLRDQQHGFCLVRVNRGGQLFLTTYGRSTGFCLDPIEKKPLHHFYPGTAVLSFGTAGCNLACKYCQNWSISAAKALDAAIRDEADPIAIAAAAQSAGAAGIAFTYNDPIIFAEYAIDTARAARAQGLYTVAVTNGYIDTPAREEFFAAMDAANVDLKAFTEAFYRRYCGGHLEPVRETLRYLVHHTTLWLEITTLIIPTLNDTDAEIASLAEWIATELAPTVPLHLTAFHPAFKLLDLPPTPPSTLQRLRAVARRAGLHYVYTGNILDPAGGATYCPRCHTPLIERYIYAITAWYLTPDGHCPRCDYLLEGHFSSRPGAFGNRRLPIRIAPLRSSPAR